MRQQNYCIILTFVCNENSSSLILPSSLQTTFKLLASKCRHESEINIDVKRLFLSVTISFITISLQVLYLSLKFKFLNNYYCYSH